MLQNARKTLCFKNNMVYKIPPGGGKPYPASGLYTTWPSFVNVEFWPIDPTLRAGRGGVVGALRAKYLLPYCCIRVILFNLINIVTMFWKNWIMTYWPHPQGQVVVRCVCGGGGVGNSCYHVAAYLIPFNSIYNVTSCEKVGLNFISLYKYTIAKSHALKWKVTSFIQKGFRRRSIDFCELYPFRRIWAKWWLWYVTANTNFMPLNLRTNLVT